MPTTYAPMDMRNPAHAERLAAMQNIAQKNIERADEDYKDLGVVRIFNIGPDQHQISMGGQGTFTIPPCPKNRLYSTPLELFKLVPDGRPVDMNKVVEVLINGFELAESIVGYGQGMGGSVDLRKFGVFVCGAFVTLKRPDAEEMETILASKVKWFQKQYRGSKVIQTRKCTKAAIQAARKNGDERDEEEIRRDILDALLPTEDELDQAQKLMNEYDLALVETANGHFRAGELPEIKANHRRAAIRTNNAGLPWVQGSIMMGKCNVCGNALAPDVAICLGCKSVVEGKEHIVIARRVPGYEHLWMKEPSSAQAPKV